MQGEVLLAEPLPTTSMARECEARASISVNCEEAAPQPMTIGKGLLVL